MNSSNINLSESLQQQAPIEDSSAFPLNYESTENLALSIEQLTQNLPQISLKAAIESFKNQRTRWEPFLNDKNTELKFKLCFGIGRFYYRSFMFREAFEFLSKGETILDQDPKKNLNKSDFFLFYNILGDVLHGLGKYDQSEKCLKRATNTIRKYFAGHQDKLYINSLNFAHLYMNKKDIRNAEDYFNKAKVHLSKVSEAQEAHFYFHYTKFLDKQGKLEQAEKYLRKSQEIYRRLGTDKIGIARCKCLSGKLSSKENEIKAQQDYEEGLKALEDCLPKGNVISEENIKEYKELFNQDPYIRPQEPLCANEGVKENRKVESQSSVEADLSTVQSKEEISNIQLQDLGDLKDDDTSLKETSDSQPEISDSLKDEKAYPEETSNSQPEILEDIKNEEVDFKETINMQLEDFLEALRSEKSHFKDRPKQVFEKAIEIQDKLDAYKEANIKEEDTNQYPLLYEITKTLLVIYREWGTMKP